MSFVTTQPEMLSTAAGDLASIGSTFTAQNTPQRPPRPPGWFPLPPTRCRR